MNTVPVTINRNLVFLDCVNHTLHIIIGFRLDVICIRVYAITNTADWLPTKQVRTQHPVTSVVVLSVRDTERVLKKMFHLSNESYENLNCNFSEKNNRKIIATTIYCMTILKSTK